MSMQLSTERIGKERIEIHVTDLGEFWAEFEDNTYRATTKLELLEQLRKAIKKASETAPIPVTVLGLVPAKPDKWNRQPDEPFEPGPGALQAKLRGEHERQSRYLLITDDKKKFQVGTYQRDRVIIARRLTAAEVEHYLELREALTRASKAVDEFENEVRADPAQLLKGGDK